MAEANNQKISRWERLKHNYRLVVLNAETFQEVGSYKLTLLNVYIAISSLIVIVGALVALLIIFTPVKRLIPGYGSGDNNSAMVKLYHDLDSLEHLAEAQDRYNEGFRRMLVGDAQTAPANAPKKTQKPVDTSHFNVSRDKADELLRKEVEMTDIRNATGNARVSPASSVNVSPNEKPLEQIYFTPPVSGSVSANFDLQKKHLGTDIIAPKNTAIKAAMDGWVVSSDWTLETGNTIAIQHTNNIVTFYKHNSVLLKKAGAYVRAGEAIAIIGNTGELTDGPHLHFELWHRGKPMNPLDFVNFK